MGGCIDAGGVVLLCCIILIVVICFRWMPALHGRRALANIDGFLLFAGKGIFARFEVMAVFFVEGWLERFCEDVCSILSAFYSPNSTISLQI